MSGNSAADSAHDQEARAVFEMVGALAAAEAVRAFVVGGAVRDNLLRNGQRLRDIDLVIEGDAREFARRANGQLGGTLQTFDRFFTAKVLAPAAFPHLSEIDFASTRTEIYERPGALPHVQLSTLEHDLRRRDFAINAMAVDVGHAAALVTLDEVVSAAAVVDQFDGQGDLQRKVISILHDASFIDDPTRLFRALRYSTRFGFALAPDTERAFHAAMRSNALSTVSANRIYNEIRKILREGGAAETLLRCVDCGLLAPWTPLRGLSSDTQRALVSALPSAASELDLLKAIHRCNPAHAPREWGLNLSNKLIAEICKSA